MCSCVCIKFKGGGALCVILLAAPVIKRAAYVVCEECVMFFVLVGSGTDGRGLQRGVLQEGGAEAEGPSHPLWARYHLSQVG